MLIITFLPLVFLNIVFCQPALENVYGKIKIDEEKLQSFTTSKSITSKTKQWIESQCPCSDNESCYRPIRYLYFVIKYYLNYILN